MQKMLSSLHTHTTFCDGKNTPEEMVQSAIKQGLKTIGFSGHAPTPADLSYCMSEENSIAYAKEILRLKAKYIKEIEILLGVEWDLLSTDNIFGVSQANFPDFSAMKNASFPLDYWIGSVHYLQKGKSTPFEIDNTKEALQNGINTLFGGDALLAVEAYFADVEKMARRKPTILGHFDLIKKLNKNGDFFDETSPRYINAGLKALQTVRENDCILEINTGGVARGYRNDFYPSNLFLTKWHELGGKIIITADAHSAENLCFGYEQAIETAKKIGF